MNQPSQLDTQERENQYRRVFYAVRTIYPHLHADEWKSIAEHIIAKPKPPRKRKRAIESKLAVR